MPDKPSVLFVCVHNAGRSQMAAAWLAHLAGDRVEVRSAGSSPGDAVNPGAVEAMREVGIDISAEIPKILTVDAVKESDVCVTMGCGDTCPVFPGKRYLDWTLEDPAGRGVEAVRPIRDEIKKRVERLIAEIAPTSGPERAAAQPRSDPEFLAFWQERHVGFLSTTRPDGTHHLVPVGVTYDDAAGIARVITSRTSKKARNIIAGGPGAVAAVSQVDGARWSTLEGTAVVNDDPEAVADAVERYTRRYRPPRVNPERVVIEITVTRTMGTVKARRSS